MKHLNCASGNGGSETGQPCDQMLQLEAAYLSTILNFTGCIATARCGAGLAMAGNLAGRSPHSRALRRHLFGLNKTEPRWIDDTEGSPLNGA